MPYYSQLVRFLLVCCLAFHFSQHNYLVSAIVFPSRGLPSRSPQILSSSISPVLFLKDLKNSVEQGLEETWTDLPLYRKRFPAALKASLVAGSTSFINSLRVLFPVALVLSIGPTYPDWKMIIKNGALTGLQWSAFSGMFSGGEMLAERLRETKDRLNPCFGSGLSGAVAQYRQGSLGMAQGFMSGVAFYYVIDKFVGGKDPLVAVSSASSMRKLTKSVPSKSKAPLSSKNSFSLLPSATLSKRGSTTSKKLTMPTSTAKSSKPTARPIRKPGNVKKSIKSSPILKKKASVSSKSSVSSVWLSIPFVSQNTNGEKKKKDVGKASKRLIRWSKDEPHPICNKFF